MSLATFLRRRRRLLLFCVATLVLHGVAIDWAGSHLAGVAPRSSALPASLMTAQLKLSLPKHVDTPQPAQPQALPARALPPRSVKAAAHAPAIAPLIPVPAAETPAAVEAVLADAATLATPVQAEQAGASAAQTGTPVPLQADGATPLAAQLAEQLSMRRYKVNLPPSADFDMDVARVDADGTRWNGAASMRWHTDGSQYQASVEAGLNLLVTRLNLLVMRSAGSIDDYGIAPATSTQKRARRAETATHFNRDAATITFSASERSYPLLVGAQDMTTVPFQLGGIGRADPNQFASDIDMQVGEDRTANIFRFQLVGEEELETRLGKLRTWHLTRPPRPGSYTSRLDIWLAPGLNWLPVQLRNTEASGALTTQTVSRITTNVTGK
ncbi:DUF3108 domain-containing protein [Duganella qianjiadongensis]|uniref:DUF3108 domain-containing protein n=1 Tax=Duganella qianjiadongensis TaxID=2692176 RepID=A0ABW9VNG5_9BURK|nr:DUF3108 domain-containing protein [Duganella qianjiadongensis]MYM40976.1 DUF3108 domain-containing protein [Duganella qianjiadongensis]